MDLVPFSLISLIIIVYLNNSSIICNIEDSDERKWFIWRTESDPRIICDDDSRGDGGWTLWSAWSECHGLCDTIGYRHRTRECSNPPPSNDGISCVGPDEQIESCYILNCTVEDYRSLVQGDLARCEALRLLEATPGLMERCLQYTCNYEDIEYALSKDNTWQINPESFWNALQCVRVGMGCPLAGEWGTWGSWSTCGSRCGKGTRWRIRMCDTPPPSDARLLCKGTPLQSESCEGDQCAVEDQDYKQSIGGAWSEWGAWSECSENCGFGVKRRRRTCNEKHLTLPAVSWGTHCRGQHDQIKVCEKKNCLLNGGWSGWSAWGPCSQTCGSGKRYRTRSCTRPIPSGGGTACTESKTDTGSCYNKPCEAYTHTVAIFNGESVLKYNFTNKRSTLYHFYVRFMAFSPHGTIMRRKIFHKSLVRLSLQKWYLCLDVVGLSSVCNIPRLCSSSVLDSEVWHSAMITVTNVAATLRINDAASPIKGTFLCEPDLPNVPINIVIGEKFRGEIEEIIVNFAPINMIIKHDRSSQTSALYPSSASNIAYEKANIEEAYLNLESEHFLRLPCFNNQDEWSLHFTLKPKKESGIIFIAHADNFLLTLILQSLRLRLKLASGEFRSESTSSSECSSEQWLDITLTKKTNSTTIEAIINSAERLHVIVTEKEIRKRREFQNISSRNYKRNLNLSRIKIGPDISKLQLPTNPIICNDEFFVGGVPPELTSKLEKFSTFSGIIASLSINGVLQDLHKCIMERYKNGKPQLSLRTASFSGSYQETAWGKSGRLNLTCLHARTIRSPHAAHWLYLDTGIIQPHKLQHLRSVDDGRILKLFATADHDLRGFYTCRAHTNKRTRNIITYGVLGKIQFRITSPDAATALAVFTTFTLVVGTLAWLILEGIYDLRNGYGFFRDRHLSPEEEAEAVCNFIDKNVHLIGSESLAKIAKDKARIKGKQLASRTHFAAQEPQGMVQTGQYSLIASSSSEPDHRPALPEATITSKNPSTTTYRVEPCYNSSPRHYSNYSSPRTRFTSSSIEPTSPRFLCSRLLMTRHFTSRENSISRRRRSVSHSVYFDRATSRSHLSTIQSSACINQSPAKTILQRFQQLKSYD